MLSCVPDIYLAEKRAIFLTTKIDAVEYQKYSSVQSSKNERNKHIPIFNIKIHLLAVLLENI